MSQKTKTGKICKNLARNIYVCKCAWASQKIFCSVLKRVRPVAYSYYVHGLHGAVCYLGNRFLKSAH